MEWKRIGGVAVSKNILEVKRLYSITSHEQTPLGTHKCVCFRND